MELLQPYKGVCGLSGSWRAIDHEVVIGVRKKYGYRCVDGVVIDVRAVVLSMCVCHSVCVTVCVCGGVLASADPQSNSSTTGTPCI